MKNSIAIALVAALGAAPAVAQGRYDISVLGVVHKITLATVGGANVVIDAAGDEIPGSTWKILDADGDIVKDDVRICDAGGGELDMPNGKLGSGTNAGNCHDGNVAYPNNVIVGVNWSR